MKNRIRIIALALAAFAVFALVSCSADDRDLLEKIKSEGKIVIATEGGWPPYTYRDENNKLVGFDVEVGTLIAEKLGVKAEFVETDWDSIIQGVESGRFDIACNGVGYTEDRAKSMNFTEAYAYGYCVLVVRKDEEGIKTFTDLKGKQTANTASSTYAAVAEGYGATVLPVTSLADTIELLVEGRIDATINSEDTIKDYMKEHPDANIKVVARDVGETFAIPSMKSERSEALIAELNRIIAELRSEGKLEELSLKYFGADNTKKPE